MALKGKIITKLSGNKQISAFTAEFTNATSEQLDDLVSFLEKEGFEVPKESTGRKLRVIEISIGLLENLRQRRAMIES